VNHHWLLVAHIAVLGYWLGSELVINSAYRMICTRDDLPFAARDAMMDHLMDADQHVRIALIAQLALGLMLAASLFGWPRWLAWLAAVVGVAWWAMVETVHRARKTAFGQRLASLDRGLRYAVMAGLGGLALVLDLPLWLRIKLALFAAVMACGVGIRLALIAHFWVWADMAGQGPTPAGNAAIRAIYRRATAILILLWALIGAIILLSILKPL
jgi:hypothetical protein